MDLIFHSDRGIQYASKIFRTFIKSNPLVAQSMIRKGNCWDNSVAESFFKTLKVELIYDDDYKTPYKVEVEFYKLKNVA
jgi:transposase InsO family protein